MATNITNGPGKTGFQPPTHDGAPTSQNWKILKGKRDAFTSTRVIYARGKNLINPKFLGCMVSWGPVANFRAENGNPVFEPSKVGSWWGPYGCFIILSYIIKYNL